MAEFGKLNFSVSFNPTSAFPLDARYYFDSLSAAQAAAASAVEVGSSEGTYYYGETVVVVEGGAATLYIIQPDKTLGAIEGGSFDIDEAIFEKASDGKLTLKGYSDAESGFSLVKGADGNIQWQKIDVDNLSQQLDTLSGTVADLSGTVDTLNTTVTEIPNNYYNKGEVDSKIASAGTLKRTIVTELPDVNSADMNTIYMIAATVPADSNSYDEYLVIENQGTKSWEKIGNTSVDLTNYVTNSKLTEELAKKVDKVDGSRLITDAEVTKLSELLNIKSVEDGELTVGEDGKLSINSISQDKITNLSTVLNNKVDKVEGSSLVSDTEIAKLATISEGAEKNVIAAVDTSEFTLDSRTLSINAIAQEKITGLPEALESAANKIEKITLGTSEAVIDESKNVTIPIAASGVLGLVTASNQVNGISIAGTGEMSVNSVSIDKLHQDADQILILNGGDAAGTYSEE